MRAAFCLLMCAAPAWAGAAPLSARGYTVVPEPQRVTLQGPDFRFDGRWRIDSPRGGEVAREALEEGLRERFGITFSAEAASRIELVLQGRMRAEEYRIDLSPGRIRIVASAPAGLFYGAGTLVQLMQRKDRGLWLPRAIVEDWPDLGLRQIYWDDAHHLEKLPELKRAIRQAAFYKINGFVLKLEGHFQFRSAPAVVEPYALSPAEYQDLTDYARRYFVELIPYLDAPAHIAFILKHPEYAPLRAFPESNYEMCAVDPRALRLISGMFADLLAANRGGRFVYLSTDEAYYVGMADREGCREKDAAARAGSPGKLLAAFVKQVADPLHDAGRTVIFWGEHPLKEADIAALPAYLVNGETGTPATDAAYRARGIRQMIYTSSQGEEKLFPDYFVLPAERRLHTGRLPTARPAENFRKISVDPPGQTGIIGAINAGWADSGLHPETFWAGYVSAMAAAWHRGSPEPEETLRSFFTLFYGPGARDMERVYRLMSWQAQAWEDSWETRPSTTRKPIFGNSNSIYRPPHPARDQWLPPDNERRRVLAGQALKENDELLALLEDNLRGVEFNRYNVEVMLTMAKLCRHNWELLLGRDGGAEARERLLGEVEAVWYRAWQPRVAAANGRKFLHELDDVKDHLADRTVELSYLLLRETLSAGNAGRP